MTQTELLTSACLQLSDGIRRSSAHHKRELWRTSGGTQRLVLTPAQAVVLNEGFAKPGTVPASLARLLAARSCPPLNEYYELLLQAHAAGVLVTGQEPTGHSLARQWPARIPVSLANWTGHGIIVLSFAALSLAGWQAPASGYDWLAGWATACILISLGGLLAACVLAGGGGEVRAPHFQWPSLFPHFDCDYAEADMAGRSCALSVAAMRLAPLALGAALLGRHEPGWLVPALGGLLYLLAPARDSVATQWLQARLGSPALSVTAGALFEQRHRDRWARWRAWWSVAGSSAFLHWAGWILLLGLVLARGLPGPAATVLALFGPAGGLHPLRDAGFYSIAAAVLFGGGALAKAAFAHWRIGRALRRPLRRDAGPGITGVPLSSGEIPDLLRQLALFAHLPAEDLAALAGAMQTVDVKRRAFVFCEDEPGDAFYVVRTGELEIRKRRPKPANGTVTIGWLGAGAGFGEISLLENAPRSAAVRAVRPSRLLKLAREDFDRLVVGRLGAVRVRELLQYAIFLGRLVFLAGWPFGELVRYAQRCGTVLVPAGARILKKGEPNIWFYLIYDGALEARDGGRVLRLMQPGDYFGEISLLGDIEATADVVAVEESRCLTMSRGDFLDFFAKDFRIGLRMEALAAQRLGSPLFAAK